MEIEAARENGHEQATSSPLQRLLRLKVQGRDGNFHELVMVHHGDSDLHDKLQECNGNTALVHQAYPSICPLRLVAPESNSPPNVQSSDSAPGLSGPAESFFVRSDAFNLVLTWLGPDDWMQLEGTCRRSRAAVASSGCWLSPHVMAGHSLRFQPEDRKAAFVRHRRAVARVAKAFEVRPWTFLSQSPGRGVPCFSPPQGTGHQRGCHYTKTLLSVSVFAAH